MFPNININVYGWRSVRTSVCINVPCFIIGVHKSILKGFVNLTIKFLQKKGVKVIFVAWYWMLQVLMYLWVLFVYVLCVFCLFVCLFIYLSVWENEAKQILFISFFCFISFDLWWLLVKDHLIFLNIYLFVCWSINSGFEEIKLKSFYVKGRFCNRERNILWFVAYNLYVLKATNLWDVDNDGDV